ncbi:MAG: lantibiotic protection ABC transporter ATP-binding protein [Ruminococcus sp.]|nr:lantibiotic protection ABC transporter ATP-binding protein [Ruminococcus sp.]
MDTILKTTALCKDFKKQRAVANVSLEIERNTVYGLLGPNGAGKSTTLKMIAGMIRPTSGSMEFNAHPWKRADLYEIGSLIETPPLYENLTAYENLKVRTTLLGLKKSEERERISEVLETVGLTDTGKKRAGQFSLGMKQRLGIAMALLSHPALLILDEPTNGLDPVGMEELRELIKSFPEKGITVILSSHILSEVRLCADHIGIMAGGRLSYTGPVQKSEDLETLFMEIVKYPAAGNGEVRKRKVSNCGLKGGGSQ